MKYKLILTFSKIFLKTFRNFKTKVSVTGYYKYKNADLKDF